MIDRSTGSRVWRRASRLSLLATALAVGCGERGTTDELLGDPGYSFYALTETIDGTAFFPPLGPEPSLSGVFDATLASRLTVVLEAEDAAGHVEALGTFTASTRPGLTLLARHEVYWMNLPAATYFTDASRAHRFRVLLDGREIGRSDLSGRVFEVMQTVPNLLVGVKLRIETRPAPAIATLAPSAHYAGSGDLTLTITGASFVRDSVVRFAGAEVATTWVSSRELTARVPEALVSAPGTFDVVVTTPAPGGGTSGAASVIVSNPAPELTAISPTTRPVGSGAFTLTIDGASFLEGVSVTFAGGEVAVARASSTQLFATIPATLLTTCGAQSVVVTNPVSAAARATASFDVACATCSDGLQNGEEGGVDCGGACTQCTDGTTAASAANDCSAILESGRSTGSGVYWIDPDGGSTSNAFRAYCDMTTDGGGWTLVLQASSSSDYVYSHAIWTNTSAPVANTTDPARDQDVVSSGFYTLPATESMLCLGDRTRCASWGHALDTARNLSNGARASTHYLASGTCTTRRCTEESMPTALRDATPGTTVTHFFRFGYVNDVNAWGTRTRVGFTGDIDSSDSSDTTLGLGLECFANCRGNSTTSGAHDRGAGYYKYYQSSTAPHDGALQGFLFVRRRTAPALNTAASAQEDCEAIRASGASQGSGLYWIQPPSAAAPIRAYCDMTTDGGGWTLVLQASSSSPWVYTHPVWTNTSAPSWNTTDPSLDQDVVSSAFYSGTATESMLCMGDLTRCASWTHRGTTPRELANGPRLSAVQGDNAFCSTFQCGPNTMPNAIRNATPGTTAAAWHRWGYVNDDNGSWGTRTRIGATADNDSSDSSDTAIGLGLECFGACRSNSVTGAPHDTGAGYYKYFSWSTAPHDNSMRGYLFTRKRQSAVLNAQSQALESCAVIRTVGASRGNGVYWIDPDGGSTSNAFRAYCDMTTDGGGWTLVLQASSLSAYTYNHAVWTNTSAPLGNTTDAAIDQDMVSQAFHTLAGRESMLCMGATPRCAAWDHALGTARALANGARVTSTQGANVFCTSFKCGSTTMPTAMRDATPGTTASAWHRWGYVNDNNAWGTRTRVGTTADNDSSDSSDTVIGLGLECFGACRTYSVTGAPHDAGAGYYKYSGWSTAPHDNPLAGALYVR
ncbi:IPT/TIG domain-containing protein [Myxococcota bacterium]|nr:IPT/TIG domain-containing protein [Myxococcota bacterium]